MSRAGEPRQERTALTTILSAIRFFVPRSPWVIAAIAILSIAMAFGEAGVLVLIVQLATMLAAGETEFELSLGPLTQSLSIGQIALLAAVLLIGLIGCSLINAVIASRLSARVVARARIQVINAFLDATWALQSRTRPGQFQELAAGHTTRLANATAVFTSAITAGFNLAILVLMAVLLSPLLAVSIGTGVLLLFVVLRPVRLALRRASRRQQALGTEFSTNVGELTGGLRDVRLHDARDAVATTVSARARSVSAAMTRTRFLMLVSPSLYQYAALALVTASLVLVSQLGAENVTSLGAVIVLLVRGLSYGSRLSTALQTATEGQPYVVGVRRELARYLDHAATFGDAPLSRVQSLSLAEISFAYDEGATVLKSISIEVDSSQVIGVVGPSGGGKTTLAHLILRLLTPIQGRFLVNGRDAQTYRAADWAREFAFVPQEIRLFRGTVAENIAYHRKCSAMDVRQAATRAHVHHEIEALPEGYQTLVGPGATDLSGGQRQRIGLARAFLGRPSIIVLDEPTSALDPRSETLVKETLDEVAGDVILIIIAHRLGTLDRCDTILVLEQGEVKAYGSADRVRADNDFFSNH